MIILYVGKNYVTWIQKSSDDAEFNGLWMIDRANKVIMKLIKNKWVVVHRNIRIQSIEGNEIRVEIDEDE